MLGVELVEVLLLDDEVPLLDAAGLSDLLLSEVLVPLDAPLLPPDLADE